MNKLFKTYDNTEYYKEQYSKYIKAYFVDAYNCEYTSSLVFWCNSDGIITQLYLN